MLIAKHTSLTRFGLLVSLFPLLTSFSTDDSLTDLINRTRDRMLHFHRSDPEGTRLKKCELTLSDQGFLRHRKFFTSGKQEYYSLNLSSIREVNYIGRSEQGNLCLLSEEDDVIVQTYNDRSGNVDSMSVRMDIQLNAIEAEDLVALERDFQLMKKLTAER